MVSRRWFAQVPHHSPVHDSGHRLLRQAGQAITAKPTPSTSTGEATEDPVPVPEKKPIAPAGETIGSPEEQTIVSAAKAALQPVISALAITTASTAATRRHWMTSFTTPCFRSPPSCPP